MNGLDDVRIAGVYTTKQSRDLSHRTGFSLALEALNGALDNAGMKLSDVDGIVSGVSGWPHIRPETPHAHWAYLLGQPMTWGGGGTGIPAVLDAAGAISTGQASTVAVVVGNVRPKGLVNAPWVDGTANEFTRWVGAFPVQPIQYALVAQRYMHQFGADAVQGMAEASATIRNYGHINPDAVYFGRGPFTAEDVLNSRFIVKPFHLLDCCSETDNSTAIIVTSSTN